MTRRIVLIIEIAILSALILAARCANYHEVFVSGNIYFTDADCYARMTRVRLCAQHPGTIVRHHNFENFPQGTNPHTTTPLDYSILLLSILLKPFVAQPIDFAGAFISPLFALMGGWFLWSWSRQMQFRYRWALLILYALSPILVHATELGRPDHQSLSLLLITIALCAEWTLARECNSLVTHPPDLAIRDSRTARLRRWSVLSGMAWGCAIWVSAYEPLLLFALVIVIYLVQDRHLLFAPPRRVGWIFFGAIILLALLIERRLPSLSIFHAGAIFKSWSRTIGELQWVSPLNPVWFRWAGYMIVLAPILAWRAYVGKIAIPTFIMILLLASYCLTIWQVRWAYFFVLIFVMALPGLLESLKWRALVWAALTLSIFPVLRDWDEKLWPNETELATRVQQRREAIELRELTHEMMSAKTESFLAPWWLSPSIAYWSGQPAVAGSSHESLKGIAESAQFFLEEDLQDAHEILDHHHVRWVFAYNSDDVAANSAAILNRPIPAHPLCRSIDRTPAQAPAFLTLVSQNGMGKLFQVANNR